MEFLAWMVLYGEGLRGAILLASVVVGWWAAGHEPWWAARRLRGALGRLRPQLARGPREAGQPAVLEGTLRLLDGPCAHLHGDPVAALSLIPPDERKVEGRHLRAASLALDVGGERLPIRGPVKVVCGSRELRPPGWPDDNLTLPDDRANELLGQHDTRLRSVQEGDPVVVSCVW